MKYKLPPQKYRLLSTDAKGARFLWFYDRLPEEFETHEAMQIANDQGTPKRTAERWLSNEAFIRIRHGCYLKKKDLESLSKEI